MARRIGLVIIIFALGLIAVHADTFKMANGDTIVGELLVASANDTGVQIKVGEGDYKRVSWANFAQEELKQLIKNPKLEPLVEPFVEITKEEKIKRTEVAIKQPPRLSHPAGRSVFGAMFSSGLGVLMLLVLYAANIYAGYEVSIFRAQPTALVCGVAAVLPIAGPIIFLAMPTKMPAPAENWEPAPAAAAGTADAVNPMQGGAGDQPAGLRIAPATATPLPGGEQPVPSDTPGAAPQKTALPEPTIFKRGQFTFNRRFFETKFPGFFGVVKRDADRDMVLVVKSARGNYTADRITRIAANDLHLQVPHGPASEEVMVPFQDIQEITLKHKDA